MTHNLAAAMAMLGPAENRHADPAAWDLLHAELGIQLPPDYRIVVDAFAPIQINGHLYLSHPATEWWNLGQDIRGQIQAWSDGERCEHHGKKRDTKARSSQDIEIARHGDMPFQHAHPPGSRTPNGPPSLTTAANTPRLYGHCRSSLNGQPRSTITRCAVPADEHWTIALSMKMKKDSASATVRGAPALGIARRCIRAWVLAQVLTRPRFPNSSDSTPAAQHRLCVAQANDALDRRFGSGRRRVTPSATRGLVAHGAFVAVGKRLEQSGRLRPDAAAERIPSPSGALPVSSSIGWRRLIAVHHPQCSSHTSTGDGWPAVSGMAAARCSSPSRRTSTWFGSATPASANASATCCRYGRARRVRSWASAIATAPRWVTVG